jgi:hypothetical protein
MTMSKRAARRESASTHRVDLRRSTASPVPTALCQPPLGRLHGQLGNRSMHRLLQSRAIQAKRTGNDETPVQASRSSIDPPAVSSTLESYIATARGSGQPLPESSRRFFEPRLGRDLSTVRLHTDAEAAGSAGALEARAYTVGQDIFFGASEYAPNTSDGRRLLAHELAHVVQQRAAPSASTATRISRSASVTCTTGTLGAPANATAIIDAAEIMGGLAIVGAGADLTL